MVFPHRRTGGTTSGRPGLYRRTCTARVGLPRRRQVRFNFLRPMTPKNRSRMRRRQRQHPPGPPPGRRSAPAAERSLRSTGSAGPNRRRRPAAALLLVTELAQSFSFIG